MLTHRHENCYTQYVYRATGRLHCLPYRGLKGAGRLFRGQAGDERAYMRMEPHEDRGRTEGRGNLRMHCFLCTSGHKSGCQQNVFMECQHSLHSQEHH